VKLREREAIHEREGGEQRELIAQLRNEVEQVTAAFKAQILGLQQEHKKVHVHGHCTYDYNYAQIYIETKTLTWLYMYICRWCCP